MDIANRIKLAQWWTRAGIKGRWMAASGFKAALSPEVCFGNAREQMRLVRVEAGMVKLTGWEVHCSDREPVHAYAYDAEGACSVAEDSPICIPVVATRDLSIRPLSGIQPQVVLK